MNYYPWVVDDSDRSFAWIDDFPKGISKKRYLLDKGVSIKEWFPENLIIDLEKGKGTKLADAIPNYDEFLVISERLKAILKDKSGAHFEFFPVRIRPQKGRMLDSPYLIANRLDTIECVDIKKSDFIMDAIIKSQVDYFKRLIINKKKIPRKTKIFRLKEKTNLILIDYELSEEIIKAKCTGMIFQEIDDYGSIFRD